MHPYIKPLIDSYRKNADPEKAKAMSKYMRNQFEYFGIKTPERRELQKAFFVEFGPPPFDGMDQIVRDLWLMPQRECQYSAFGIMGKLRRKWYPEMIDLLEWLIVTKSWWDTVDGLATGNVGTLFSRFSETMEYKLPSWRRSDNFWLRRTAILFQLNYKDETDFPLLGEIIEENLGSKEFFINKAIGWALRQYSKTDSQAVIDYVAKTDLHSLSEREALKWMRGKNII